MCPVRKKADTKSPLCDKTGINQKLYETLKIRNIRWSKVPLWVFVNKGVTIKYFKVPGWKVATFVKQVIV